MAVLTWDGIGERVYETGVDHGVLYLRDGAGDYSSGFAWNGLTTVTESPTGAEPTALYADNIKYLNLLSAEEFGATVEAYTYPDEFAECDGTVAPQPGVYVGQQPRKTFGLSYRTILGNDVDLNEHGYKLHLIYGALAAPSEKAYNTVNDTPEGVTFSWELSTTPVEATGMKPTASLTIDSTAVPQANLDALETILYGQVGVDPRLPTPDEVIALFDGSVTEVTTVAPTYNDTTDEITIPVVVGVDYKIDGEIVTGDVPITEDTVVTATPQEGYVFSSTSVDAWSIVFV